MKQTGVITVKFRSLFESTNIHDERLKECETATFPLYHNGNMPLINPNVALEAASVGIERAATEVCKTFEVEDADYNDLEGRMNDAIYKWVAEHNLKVLVDDVAIQVDGTERIG